MKKMQMYRFMNTEIKSGSDSPDSKKNRDKI